jgi:hypothetical protein
MEPKTETTVSSVMQGLANKFLKSTNIDKNATRIELGNILKERFNLDGIATTMNRQGRRNKVLNDVSENKLEFKYMAIMLADSHSLFEGWLNEFKIRDFIKILTIKIVDFESGKTDSEIKTKEAVAPYREFQESIQKLIPPLPVEDKKKQPGVIDLGKK